MTKQLNDEIRQHLENGEGCLLFKGKDPCFFDPEEKSLRKTRRKAPKSSTAAPVKPKRKSKTEEFQENVIDQMNESFQDLKRGQEQINSKLDEILSQIHNGNTGNTGYVINLLNTVIDQRGQPALYPPIRSYITDNRF
jgi:hypothetical protein